MEMRNERAPLTRSQHQRRITREQNRLQAPSDSMVTEDVETEILALIRTKVDDVFMFPKNVKE